MSDKSIYSINKNEELEWHDHIRLRPGMYIGQVNNKGFVEMLKGIICSAILSTQSDYISIELQEGSEAKIGIINPNGVIENNWGQFKRHPVNQFSLEIFALNALSEKFNISFWDKAKKKIGEQHFEKGKLIGGDVIEKINCSFIEVKFLLDKDIWGADFSWNTMYITHHLREFAYLYKRTKFDIKYEDSEEGCRVVYHFKNGLKDRIDIEVLNGLGSSYFETEIDEKIGEFHIEAAFAFRDYSVDPPYLKSYVNDFLTFENGSHVDGLLKGLTYGVMKYFQKNKLTQDYKISEKGMKENLVAAINIKMQNPVYSGCVKNKLANSEIIESIANYIAELLFDKIEKDEEATKKLIRKFAI